MKYMIDIYILKHILKSRILVSEREIMETLNQIIRINSRAFDDFIILKAKFAKLQKINTGKILLYEEINLKNAKFLFNLIQFINLLNEEDFIFPTNSS